MKKESVKMKINPMLCVSVALASEAMQNYRYEFETKKQLMFESFDQMKAKELEQSNLAMLVVSTKMYHFKRYIYD